MKASSPTETVFSTLTKGIYGTTVHSDTNTLEEISESIFEFTTC